MGRPGDEGEEFGQAESMAATTLPQRLAGLRRKGVVLVGTESLRRLIAFAVPVTSTLLLLMVTGCGQEPAPPVGQRDHPNALMAYAQAASVRSATNSGPSTPAMYSYTILHTWPHDRKAFTQGLVFQDGELLESTGVNGQSSLRRVELQTGRVLQQIQLPYQYFAEGLVVFGRRLFQLTWLNGKCFVYDLASFRKQTEFSYSGEGWGLTTDDQSLIMSDGTDRIRFLNPDTFELKRSIHVTAEGRPLNRLNELEYIKGEIFANIWQSDFVARIDPATGKVLGLVDFSGLLTPTDRDASTDVFNGIAYDRAGDRIFVTGKYWPKLFEVRLKPK
jgi:glutaminyl-peptide cyclotransferase